MGADDMNGIAVAQRGGIVAAERAGGMANRDLGVACAPGTRFHGPLPVLANDWATDILLVAADLLELAT